MKSAWAFLAAFIILVLVAVGWIMNIVKLIGATEIGGEELVRIIGIFAAPIGTLMGWFV